MTIGVDGNDANVEKQVGVSVYTYNLLSYFQENASEETKFNIYLRQSPGNHMPQETKHFRYKVVKGPALWSQIFLPLNLRITPGVDVFFSPAYYTPRFSPVPLVVTIHDL